MSQNDTCEIYCYDEAKVRRIKDKMEKEDIARAATLFKALADENRAKTVYALCQEKELCVCDVANIINSTVATASHHLRALRKQGIVKFRKDGKLAFYSLDDEHLQQLIEVALAHKNEVNIND